MPKLCCHNIAGAGSPGEPARSGHDSITRNTEDLAASMQLMAYWEPTGGQGDIDTGLCTPREVHAAAAPPPFYL